MVVEKNEFSFYRDIDIRFYDCDRQHRAKLETLLKYAADIAGIAYTAKGYSHSWLWEHGFVFLLSRASFSIARMPVADEAITLETWEREVKGPLFLRDVVFYDQNGIAIVSCSTAWSLVNPASRTIVKPSAFTGRIDPHPEKVADCPPACRLKEEKDAAASIAGVRRVVYSDIDGNGHVYNAVYGAIACDFLPRELTDRELSSFCINFKQEALLDEDITVSITIPQENDDNSNAKAYVSGRIHTQEAEEKVSFICEFEFK